MNKIKYLYLCTLISMIISCSDYSRFSNENVISISLGDEPSFVAADSVFAAPFYLPLETTEESLLYDIDKIIQYNNTYYVLDRKQDAIFHFDKSGKYIQKLSHKGIGPDEYLSLDDFFLKDDALYILSSAIRKILIYNDSFSFVTSYKIDNYGNRIHYIDNQIYIYNNYSSHKCKNIDVLDIKTGKTIHRYADFAKKQIGVGYTSKGFAKCNDTLFISFPYDYTIHKITDDDYRNYLSVDFGQENMFSNKWLKMSDEEREEKIKFQYSESWELPVNKIDNLFISEEYIIFSFVHRGSEHFFILNKSTGKSFTGYIFDTKQFPFAHGKHQGFIEGHFVESVQSDMILQIFENQKNKIDTTKFDFLKNLKPDDNPVLCFYSLKI